MHNKVTMIILVIMTMDKVAVRDLRECTLFSSSNIGLYKLSPRLTKALIVALSEASVGCLRPGSSHMLAIRC